MSRMHEAYTTTTPGGTDAPKAITRTDLGTDKAVLDVGSFYGGFNGVLVRTDL